MVYRPNGADLSLEQGGVTLLKSANCPPVSADCCFFSPFPPFPPPSITIVRCHSDFPKVIYPQAVPLTGRLRCDGFVCSWKTINIAGVMAQRMKLGHFGVSEFWRAEMYF